MRAFTPLTLQERLLVTAAQADGQRALWHELSSARGLAEARLRERELEHMRALPGFTTLEDEAQALLSAAFLHECSTGLTNWQEHGEAAARTRARWREHFVALGLPAPSGTPGVWEGVG